MYIRHRDPTGTSEPPASRASAAPFSYSPETAYTYASDALPAIGSVKLRGVSIHRLTEGACVERICTALSKGRGGTVVTPNLDHLRRCATDATFRSLVADAELVVADGMPLVWASRLQGTPLPERVAGSNLIISLSAAAAAHGHSVFLLGGAPGTAQLAGEVLRTRFPHLNVAGTCCPSEGFERDPRHVSALAEQLRTTRPDIVFVALGSPKQEKLIERLRPTLPQAWWLGVGISFSFLCGDVRRAPVWMQSAGLEWAHRLAQEPRRLFKRYVVSGLPFAADLLARSAVKGAMRRVLRRGEETAVAAASAPTASVILSKPNCAAAANVPVAAPLELQVFVGNRKPRPAVASRVRALVLLGGSVRPTPLHLATGRSVLDLPLDLRGSVLAGWLTEAASLHRSLELDSLPVRVMVNHDAPMPTSVDGFIARSAGLRIERDASEYRGTGGVLRDLAEAYEDDDLLLVANAAQVLLDPLDNVVDALARCGGDVSVVSHQDGTPTGVMLVACRALREIASEGFVDMKEQALPRIASRFDVRVLSRPRPSGLPLRTLEDYVSALRYHHRRFRGGQGSQPLEGETTDPLAENLSPAFALVESGAELDPTARLHDAVVLSGGIVEAGAVLVRSVVCAGGVVRREKSTVDQFVTAPAAGKLSIGRRRKDRVA
jgi:N-acetylglucosaminyldiphosphoundecaprenol N-acetyl-beta-D-mannosaminyltransferase